MTTPLSKMVALLIPSPLTPKRGRCSAGRLSEAKKRCGEGVWCKNAPTENRGRIEHYSVFYTEKNVRKIQSLLTLEAYRFFQHWLNVGRFLENFVLLLV